MKNTVKKTDQAIVVSLNPAIDVTGTINELQRGCVNRVDKSQTHPAGKGFNVAKVLCELGAQVTLTGFLGEANATLFLETFESIGIFNECIQIPGQTRTNLKIIEDGYCVTEINFPGFSVNEAQIHTLETQLFKLAETHDYIVITGSLPINFPAKRLRQWIEQLNALNKRVILDTSSETLQETIQGLPFLIKPNKTELSEIAGQKNLLAVMSELHQKGIKYIILSDGEKGILCVSDEGQYVVVPPIMPVQSTVGAGDTLVAGLCWGFMQQIILTGNLRFATALSALSVTQIGVGMIDKDKLEDIIEKCTIEKN